MQQTNYFSIQNILLFLLIGGVSFLVSAKSQEKHKRFYWERPNTGVAWFAKDHRECMQEADLLPFEWLNKSRETEKLKLRFDEDSENSVWAQFIPYPGAQPVYVNYIYADWSVDYEKYKQCMKMRGYEERVPDKKENQ